MSCKNAVLDMPLVSEPGEQWEYGIGIDWAGKAIERVTGKNLQSFFDENLFSPLGMRDTAFALTADSRTRLGGVHVRLENGSLEPMAFELPQEPEFQMGGGALYGTAADYIAFEQMFLNEGRSGSARILRPETIRLMGQNHMGGLQVRMLPRSMPYSNDAEFFPGVIKRWGLAFMLNTQAVPGGRSANSLAWAGMLNTFNWLDPAKKLRAFS